MKKLLWDKVACTSVALRVCRSVLRQLALLKWQNLIHQANETGFVSEQKRQRKITLAEEEYK